MKVKRYRRWNWEFDYGTDEIMDDNELAKDFATVYYDQFERLYRVEVQRSDIVEEGAWVYDYFCDMNGRVLQKRSLDERGGVFLIVDIEYCETEIIETAWMPENGLSKSIRRMR